MTIISLLSASVAPGAALLTYFYLRDNYGARPVQPVLKVFLLGILLVFPTMVIQRGFVLGFSPNDFFFAFLISAGIEEFVKWFMLYFVIYKHSDFTKPYDGIIYAAAVSLGFATLENIIYAWSYQTGLSTLLLRGLLPVSAHALFAVFMGYYLGAAKFFSERARKKHLALSLWIPVLLHGTFDYMILLSGKYWFLPVFPFMIWLWFRGLRKLDRANSTYAVYRNSGPPGV